MGEAAPRTISLAEVTRAVWRILTAGQRGRLFALFALMFITALVDAFCVSMVLPFLAWAAEPEALLRKPRFSSLLTAAGLADARQILLFLGGAALLAVIVTTVLRLATLYAIRKFSFVQERSFASRLFAAYIRQPYTFFAQRHSADFLQRIFEGASNAANRILIAGLDAVAKTLAALVLAVVLVAMDTALALALAVTLALVYGIIHCGFRWRFNLAARHEAELSERRYRQAAEALADPRTLKLYGMEERVAASFDAATRALAGQRALVALVMDAPRYFLELLCFGGAIAIALFLLASRQGVGGALPWLGLYALAGYRLFPAVQYAFASISMVRYHSEGFLRFAADLETLERMPPPPPAPPISALRQKIEIRGLTYFYPGRPAPAVHDVSFAIPKGKMVAIVGKSGAGKTTLLDLLLGFLQPEAGEILIDGRRLEAGNVRYWQNQLGYVPQHFFLLDDTFLANIAVGAEAPDMAAAERACRIAEIHDFIASLPQGYHTVVGERGSRLSGGQRQRLAIARALYRDPPVVILDEATSALDAATEAAIMASIRRLAEGRTVIFATHRLSTLRYCEPIYFLENGRLIAAGSYGEMLRQEPRFAVFAGSGEEEAALPGQGE